MSTPNRSLTPSQLSNLEQTYAKSPADGWRDLAEAYLARGRYMEAMVVAKRGARVHPGDPGPHLVLARIHGAQRKTEKARAAAAEALKLGPTDAAVVALAREHGLLPPEQPDPKPDTAAAQAAQQGIASATSSAPGAAGDAPTGTAAATPQADDPAKAAAGLRWTEDLARRYGEGEAEDPASRRKRAKRSAARTLALAAALGAVLAIAGGVTASRRARAEEQQHLLVEAHRLIDKDTWPAYRDAQAACEKAAQLGADDTSAAYACAAWAAAVRWAEHGEGDALRAKAQEHLAHAGARGERAREATLADAWLKLHGSDARGAVELLRARSARDANASVRAALGVALAASGDLDGGRDALTAAQQLAPGNPRIAEQLADALRRRGPSGAADAATLYEIVLQKLAPDHVPSLVGKAQLMLDSRNVAGALATAQRVSEMKDQASPRQRARALVVASRALALEGKKAEAEAAEREARGLDATALELRGPVAQAGR